MDYEIGKQLKDAGFPLQPASMEDGKDSIRRYQIFSHGLDSIGREGIWLYPILEELIEACGERFASLAQIQKSEWQAVGPWKGKDGMDRLIINFNQTPTEAVAKLWLALQKKS